MLGRIWYDARMDDPTDDPTRAAVAWLLASDEPAVRYLTRRDLLGDPDSEAAAADAARVLEGPMASALLAGQRPDGGFGIRPYSKWTGAHWRLVSLVELAAPAGEPRLPGGQRPGGRLPARHGRRAPGRAARQVAGRLAVAGRRLELRPAGQRPPLVVPRVAPTGLGPARVLAGHRRDLGPGGGRAGGRAVPLPPAVPLPRRRPGDRPALAEPALPALLALRRAPGAADPVPAGQGRRPPSRRRPRRGRPAPPPRRPLAAGRRLVARPRRHLGLRPARGGRLGALGIQRAAHPQRPPRPAGGRQPGLRTGQARR